MLQKALRTATVVTTLLLVACGGNDAPESTSGQPADGAPTLQAQYEALLLQVNEAKAEAEAKAKLDCTSNEQCSTLSFRSPLGLCFDTTLDYSTADSANAAEVAAAATRYAEAATAAEAVAPPSNVSGSCFTNVDLSPLTCVDNRCQRGGFVFEGPSASGT